VEKAEMPPQMELGRDPILKIVRDRLLGPGGGFWPRGYGIALPHRPLGLADDGGLTAESGETATAHRTFGERVAPARFRPGHAESPCGCEVAAGKVHHRLSMEEMNTRGAFQRLESERVVATVCGRNLCVDSVTADLSTLFVDSTHTRGFSVRDATTA